MKPFSLRNPITQPTSMSPKQDIQKDRGHANSPMSPDSSRNKVQYPRGNRAMLSAENLECRTHISAPVTQLNPVPGTSAVLRDNLSNDPTLGLITCVQRVPNGASSSGSNKARAKACDHGHNTGPKAQVPSVKCPFVRDIHAGRRVYRQPVTFNQDTMQLLWFTPEHPGFLGLYMTGLDSPSAEIELYIAYVPDEKLSHIHVYEMSPEDAKQCDIIFNSPLSVPIHLMAQDVPHTSHGTTSAKFNKVIGPQDRGHRSDPGSQEQVSMEEYISSLANLKEQDAVRCCLCDEAFPRPTLGNHLRRKHELDIGDKT
ncbi:hypothetical protein EDD18DRAFT_1460254, partial [Armillaria luteobubalina]